MGSQRDPAIGRKIRLGCERAHGARRVGKDRVQLKLQLADALRNSPMMWRLHAVALTAKSLTQSAPEDRLLTLAQAYRRWPSGSLESRLRRESAAVWREKKIGWQRYQAQIAGKTLIKSLILKAPGADGEKGVLYVSFEYNWLR